MLHLRCIWSTLCLFFQITEIFAHDVYIFLEFVALDKEQIKLVQNYLTTVCCAVKDMKKYQPRLTQIVACARLIFNLLTRRSILLEIATGEGKSCTLAMFSVFCVWLGKKIDIITSSPVLACRDSESWRNFYDMLDVSVDTNCSTDETEKPAIYSKDIVYGTVSFFAGDILREEFKLENIRMGRPYDLAIVDEVDSLLLDQGIQITYLTNSAVGMRHVESVLALIWAAVTSYKKIIDSIGDTYFIGGANYMHEKVFEYLKDLEIGPDSPGDVLQLLENNDLLPKQSALLIAQSNTMEANERDQCRKSIYNACNPQKCIDYINKNVNECYILLCSITNGTLCIPNLNYSGKVYKVVHVKDGVFAEVLTLDEIQSSVADILQQQFVSKDVNGLNIPTSLHEFVLNQASLYTENALIANEMAKNREYTIEDNRIIPVDYSSTGVIERNKKWGSGLQQFLEFKHGLAISQLTIITNFLSNFAFFDRYSCKGHKQGPVGIYGVTGTLGSNVEKEFMEENFQVSVGYIPRHKINKTFSLPVKSTESKQEWLRQCCKALSRAYKERRPSLVICEDIQTVHDLCSQVRDKFPQVRITLYYNNSEKDNTNNPLNQVYKSGDVLIATNLAGRGTDIQIDDEALDHGGMFLLLTFLPKNRRVLDQALGRTGRKGQPGSYQLIICQTFKLYKPTFEEDIENKLAQETESYITTKQNTELPVIKFKDKLFATYCASISSIRRNKTFDSFTISILHERWGLWLQTRTKEISNIAGHKRQEEKYCCELKYYVKDSILKLSQDTLIFSNFHQCTRSGSLKMRDNDFKLAEHSYNQAKKKAPLWAMAASYLNGARIIKERQYGYVDNAIAEIKNAKYMLQTYNQEAVFVSTTLSIASTAGTSEKGEGLKEQIAARLEVLRTIEAKMEDNIKALQVDQNTGHLFEVKHLDVIGSVSQTDECKKEAYEWCVNGLELLYDVTENKGLCWDGFLLCLIGACEVLGRICIGIGFASLGMGQLSEGVSDMISGLNAMVTGILNWAQWAIEKAMSLAICLVCGGLAKLAKVAKGSVATGKTYQITKSVYQTIKIVGYSLKQSAATAWQEAKTSAKKIMKVSWNDTVKHSLREAAKFVGKLTPTLRSGYLLFIILTLAKQRVYLKYYYLWCQDKATIITKTSNLAIIQEECNLFNNQYNVRNVLLFCVYTLILLKNKHFCATVSKCP